MGSREETVSGTGNSEVIEKDIGQRLPTRRLNRISDEQALSMASLSQDFHPYCLLRERASEGGHADLILHHLWVSGLVNSGLQGIAEKGRVTHVVVEYAGTAYRDTRLVFEPRLRPAAIESDGREMSFEVLADGKKLIARGSALIEEEVRGAGTHD